MKRLLFRAALLALAGTTLSCEGTGDVSTDAPFRLEVGNIGYASAECRVIPSDPQMNYIAMVRPAEVVDSFAGDEDLVAGDYEYFKAAAASWGLSVEDYVSKMNFHKGEHSFTPTGLVPDTEYCLYAYGLELGDGVYSSLTTVERKYFTTLVPDKPSDGFGIEAEADGNSILMVVTPPDDGTLYYMDVVRAEDLASYGGSVEENIEAFAKEYIQGYLVLGLSIEQVGKKGIQSYHYKNLFPNALYYAYAFELADDGGAKSDVYYVEVMTGIN